jgi:hypothetical protein
MHAGAIGKESDETGILMADIVRQRLADSYAPPSTHAYPAGLSRTRPSTCAGTLLGNYSISAGHTVSCRAEEKNVTSNRESTFGARNKEH